MRVYILISRLSIWGWLGTCNKTYVWKEKSPLLYASLYDPSERFLQL